jgi:hypothetical protein
MSKTREQLGKKHPQMYLDIGKLHLDTENPRLPENIQGAGETELLKALYKGFNLDELMDSMSQNGYFDEEPLVVIPQKMPPSLASVNGLSKEFKEYIEKDTTIFTVVEGNRRIAAAKILLNPNIREKLNIRHLPEPQGAVIEDLKLLPAIVYSKREDVVPYLGVRHIVGIQKWDSYAKARYIARLIDQGNSIAEVETQIGDSQGSVRKNYISYKLLQQVKEEFDYNTKHAETNFSLLILAVGQGKIKRYLGLASNLSELDQNAPVSKENMKKLQNLTSWIFGDERNSPVIDESRDITDYLSPVVDNSNSLKHLERTRDLKAAYDLSDGEEQMVLKYLANINTKVQTVLGLAHLHKTPEILSEVEKCYATVKQLLKTVKGE